MTDTRAPWKRAKFLVTVYVITLLAVAYAGELTLTAPDSAVRSNIVEAVLWIGGIFLGGQSVIDSLLARFGLRSQSSGGQPAP